MVIFDGTRISRIAEGDADLADLRRDADLADC
jgi:hypothetical protein